MIITKSYGFLMISGGIEVNWLAQTCLILEPKFADNPEAFNDYNIEVIVVMKVKRESSRDRFALSIFIFVSKLTMDIGTKSMAFFENIIRETVWTETHKIVEL